jgi:hypothetical protein
MVCLRRLIVGPAVHSLILGAVFAVLLPAPRSFAQEAAPPPEDEISTAAIREATTDEEYLTPWVEELPDHPTVPGPRDFLGYTIGAPGELTSVDEIHGYMRALAESSPRVSVFPMGSSFENREMILVVIADQETMQRLAEYKGYLHRLADPWGTGEEEAERIIGEAKPVYWITAGLHSPELGPPEMAMELAYRLAVEEREPFRSIRENVITLITPVLEVDGRTRQVEWYRRHVKGHTDYKDMPPRSAPFWGHYTYHDNNRDAIAVSQPLTRNYFNTFFEWLPTVSLDLHESVPLLYVSTGTGPYNERVDPLTVTEWHALANYEVSRLTAMGLPGVWTWGFYTGWFPGYLLWVTNMHNSMGRFFETFGNGSADTMERDLKEMSFSGKKITSRQWYRSIPPKEKITWSMRNNTNYMESGVLASLEMTARNGGVFLSNFYRKGVNAVEQGQTQSPHAFVIPQEQRDRAAARMLVDILHRQHIEVETAEAGGEYGAVRIEKGDLVVKLDQPYGPLAASLLEKQSFPRDVEVPPYDDVAWTLGLHLGVEVVPVKAPGVLELEGERLEETEPVFSETEVPEKAAVWAVPHRGQRELGPLRFALSEVPMRSAAEPFQKGRREFPAGTLLIQGEDVSPDVLHRELVTRGLDAVAMKRMPEVSTHELDVPRIALLQSWRSTQNAGWVRFTLDEAGVPYTLITKDRLRGGGLRADFDVVLIPSFWSRTRAKDIVAGLDPDWGPLAYESTPQTPSHGVIARSEDITGGFGFLGLEELRRFVVEGGTLITLSSAGVLVAETGMVRDVTAKRPRGLRTPGSFLATKVLRSGSPLVYGYEDTSHVFRGNGPLFSVKEHDRHLVVMQFGTKEVGEEDDAETEEERPQASPLVLSGGVVRGEAVDGEPALLSLALGDGRMVIMSWNPMHRYLNHHDHAFLYNALLHWNDLPVPSRESAEADAPKP